MRCCRPQDIKEFERTTRELANRCTDVKLRDQLLATIAKLPTIANQLKILATVQAANPNDSDSDNESMVRAGAPVHTPRGRRPASSPAG